MHNITLLFSSRYFVSDVLLKHSVKVFNNAGYTTHVKQLSKNYMLPTLWNCFAIIPVQFQITVCVI